MNLKTLLLGSAASLMAVTSSFAADAVIAEPEAVEYVRVCDAFGSGFFFIPGSETCLKIGGDVRVQYIIADIEDGLGAQDTLTQWRYRARLGVNSATESDLGTLTTFFRFETGGGDQTPGVTFDEVAGIDGPEIIAGFSNTDPVRNNARVDQAIIGIGGLSLGFGDSYWARNIGFGLVGAIVDGIYGYGQELYVEYTYEVAGFALTGGVSQFEPDDPENGGPGGGQFAENPNLYIGANYGASFGSIGITGYYTNASGIPGADDGVDGNIGLQLRPFEGLNLEAFVLGGDGAYTANAGGVDANVAYGVGLGYTFNKLTPYVLYSGTDGNVDDYVSVGAFYNTNGLTLQAEASFEVDENLDAAGASDGLDDQYSFRVVKSF